MVTLPRAICGALLSRQRVGWRVRRIETQPLRRSSRRGYSDVAARRLVRDVVPALLPARDGWDEVVALRRECGLLKEPGPRAQDVIDDRLLARAAADEK